MSRDRVTFQGSGRSDEIVAPSAGTSVKQARGLLHTLSQIQIMSQGEKRAGDYDPNMIATVNIIISYSWEGFIITAIPLIFTFLTLPISLSVLNNYLPAFGTYERSLVDNLLVFALSLSPGLLKVLFVAFFVSTFYLGRVTDQLTKYLIHWGMIPTLAIFGILGFFFYQIIYFKVLSVENCHSLARAIGELFSGNKKEMTEASYRVLISLRKSIPLSSFIYVGYCIAEVLILLSAYYFAKIRTKRLKALRLKWLGEENRL